MRERKSAGLVQAALCMALATPAAAETRPPFPTGPALDRLLAAHDVPGIAMVTLKDCEPEGPPVVAGNASLQPAVAVTPATVFESASLSKPVFAWLVMQLVDEQVIDLDRPFAQSFDYVRIPDKAAYAQLTPRLVLSHRTGLPNWVDGDTDFPQRTAPIPFTVPPDTTYSYSGEAYQLLQAFVEHKTGSTLQALFEQRLGRWMPDSTFTRPLRPGTVASRAYRSARDADSGRDMTNLTGFAMSAASLVTTAQDYARFLSLVCKREGLSRAAYDDMLRPQTPVPRSESLLPTFRSMGWAITDAGGTTLVSHSGNNGAYRAFAGFVQESRDGVVILTNGAKGRELIDALLQPPPAPASR
ncbi:serine hydrolase domain-containing protein [Roseateles sp. DC23W]|uniref:Serine hydrolase domain-containing protein n=1 Tax=Pelomonas dachongensis TaxID=3299029 RepID=A0ABW7EMB2_9BURK